MIDLKKLNKSLNKATDLEARLRECTDRKEDLDLMWEELAARNDCNNLFRDSRKELLRLAEIGKLAEELMGDKKDDYDYISEMTELFNKSGARL